MLDLTRTCVSQAHGMVRREAPTQSPLQEVQQHAAEFQKTITEQWNALVNSKNTQAVNKALKEGSDSVLQQLSQLSTSLQGAVSTPPAPLPAPRRLPVALSSSRESNFKSHPS